MKDCQNCKYFDTCNNMEIHNKCLCNGQLYYEDKRDTKIEITIEEAELILEHLYTDRNYYDRINADINALRNKLETEIKGGN